MRAFSGAALLARLADAGPAVSSCGQAGDHFAVSTIEVMPDPPEHGQAVTFTLEGTFDRDIPEVVTSADVEVSALGFIHHQVQGQVKTSFSPTLLRSGQQTVTIGPLTLPPNVPGSVGLKGRSEVTTPGGEPVMCVELDLELPAMKQALTASPRAESTGVSDCGRAMDTNITADDGAASFTLDEDISSLEVDLDFELHAGFLKVPMKLRVPLSAEPGVPKGDYIITGEALDSTSPGLANSPVTATGTVALKVPCASGAGMVRRSSAASLTKTAARSSPRV